MITIDDFKKVEIKVGLIKKAERIEGSNKMLRLEVDFGEDEPRQVLSGIGTFIPELDDLVGVRCPFVTNLPEREMMGLKSQAMIMAVSSDENFSLLNVNESIPLGTTVS